MTHTIKPPLMIMSEGYLFNEPHVEGLIKTKLK